MMAIEMCRSCCSNNFHLLTATNAYVVAILNLVDHSAGHGIILKNQSFKIYLYFSLIQTEEKKFSLLLYVKYIVETRYYTDSWYLVWRINLLQFDMEFQLVLACRWLVRNW